MRRFKKLDDINSFFLDVKAPPSKAHSIRAIIMSALSNNKSSIIDPLLGTDQFTALSCIDKMGVKYNFENNNLIIENKKNELNQSSDKMVFDCEESGLTARIITALACSFNNDIIITASERMKKARPIKDLIDSLTDIGFEIEYLEEDGFLPVNIPKQKSLSFLKNEVVVSIDKSSQFLTALLMLAPLLPNGLIIRTTGDKKSTNYIDITIELMKKYGIYVKVEDESYIVRYSDYNISKIKIEGDYSSSAFFGLAAAITGGKSIIHNLNPDSKQGDRYFFDILEKMGCNIDYNEDTITVIGKAHKNLDIDMKNYPDIVMPLAAVMATISGKHRIYNIEHLRIKESDRIRATAINLKKFNIKVIEHKDSLEIFGNESIGNLNKNIQIESFNDHRIAMSFSILGLLCGNVSIDNEKCINKSFPSFWDKFSDYIY